MHELHSAVDYEFKVNVSIIYSKQGALKQKHTQNKFIY